MILLKSYGEFLLRHLKLQRKIKAVFDGSNGSTGPILEYIERRSKDLKLELQDVNPDGNFAAHGPNPLHRGALKDLSSAVLKNEADFGAEFDADGDRVVFVDDRGRPISYDIVSLLMLLYLKPRNMIFDVRHGFLLRDMRPKGTKLTMSRVGSVFIKEAMHKKDIEFGAEESGHYYFKQFFYADSGIMAAVLFASAVSEIVGVRLSEWIDGLPEYHRSPELNFKFKNKVAVISKIEKHFKNRAKHISRIDGVRMEFISPKGEWWFSLRPSNTENLLRLNVEATNKALLKGSLTELRRLL